MQPESMGTFPPKLSRSQLENRKQTLKTIDLQRARSASSDKYKHLQTPTPTVRIKSKASKNLQGIALYSSGDVDSKYDFQLRKAKNKQQARD